MKYLGYALILIALVAGYVEVHPIAVVVLALISTFIYAAARRKALKTQIHAPDQNMLLDGAFLLALQSMIMFTAYILGWFFANRVALGAG